MKFLKSTATTTKLFLLVHSDVCGPFKTSAYNGALYFVTFINDYNRWILITFMKIKNQMLEEFKIFKGIVETITWHKLNFLQTNNGGEYIFVEFRKYCSDHGIIHQFFGPHSLENNKTTGRKNRSLCETVGCFLHQSHIPKTMWLEAIRMACYLFSKHPTKSLNNHIPKQLFTRKNRMSLTYVFFVHESLPTYPNTKEPEWIPR